MRKKKRKLHVEILPFPCQIEPKAICSDKENGVALGLRHSRMRFIFMKADLHASNSQFYYFNFFKCANFFHYPSVQIFRCHEDRQNQPSQNQYIMSVRLQGNCLFCYQHRHVHMK